MILAGCVAFARYVGATRVETELLPQCWEQVNDIGYMILCSFTLIPYDLNVSHLKYADCLLILFFRHLLI